MFCVSMCGRQRVYMTDMKALLERGSLEFSPRFPGASVVQPFSTESAAAVYNGEIYNHHELRPFRGVRCALHQLGSGMIGGLEAVE